MRYPSDRPATRYVGWQLSENLIECRRTKDGPKELCAQFRYVVLHDGVEIPQKAKIHLPESIALSRADLESASPRAYVAIMGIKGSLAEHAIEKFKDLDQAETISIHYDAKIIPMRHAPVETQQRKLAMGE